jgi:hypothetical protein
MIGSKIKAIVKEPNENGDVHIETCIDDDIDIYESLAAVGSIVTDLITMSNGKLDVENFVAAIRGIYYNGF